jgi:hypothetical protein
VASAIKEGITIRREDFLPPGEIARRHIDAYRKTTWFNIKRDLALKYGSPPVEPFWTAPGKAIYWQVQTRNVGVEAKSKDGRKIRPRLREEVIGWAITRQPASNAEQIAHYLDKGLLLRPPPEMADVEVVEDAPPAAVRQGEPETKRDYVCKRHGKDKRFAFAMWGGYVQHCVHYNEAPQRNCHS